MPYTYQQAKSAVFSIDNIRLTVEATVSRGLRLQVAQFGDGYNQTALDGLNSQLEKWSIRTAPMSNEEAWGLESWVLRTKGSPFLWTPPDSTKTFRATVTSGKVQLGYQQLASVTLDGYTNPTNYTVNLATGVVTSVNISNGTTVLATVVLAPKYFQPTSEWTVTELGPNAKVISFEVKRVYV